MTDIALTKKDQIAIVKLWLLAVDAEVTTDISTGAQINLAMTRIRSQLGINGMERDAIKHWMKNND